MDYVKETLQRQANLWLTLFGGGEEPEMAEHQQEKTGKRPAAGQEGLYLRNTASGDELPEQGGRAVWQGRGTVQAEKELLQRGREMLLRETAFRKRAVAEHIQRQKMQQTVQEEPVNAELARWAAEAALREGRSDLETADAKAISRRFERDARRYDGGFVFY